MPTLATTVNVNNRGSFQAWVICLSSGLFFFYEFFQLNIFDVINQFLLIDFNINASQLSFLSSTYLWADLFFLLPAGIILDRYSTKNVILIALAICIIGTFGFAFTNSFIFAAFFRFLVGIGNAFCFLACILLVSRWFLPNRQALVIGLIITLAFLGGMTAHTPFGYLTTYYGWRQILIIDAIGGIILLLWLWKILADSPVPLTKTNYESNIISHLCNVIKNKQTWFAGLYTSFLNLPIMVLCALWGASYLQTVYHLNVVNASNIINLIFIGSIIGCPFIGWLSDWQQKRKPLIIWGSITTLLTLLPLFLFNSLSIINLGMIFFALGFFTSTQILSYPLIADNNKEEDRGTATGFASILIMAGAALGQIFFGLLLQTHSNSTNVIYKAADFQYALWIFPITTIASLFLGLLLKEKKISIK